MHGCGNDGIKDKDVAMNKEGAFAHWFLQTTGYAPYPFQVHFACGTTLPEFVDVPTGMAKTAMSGN